MYYYSIICIAIIAIFLFNKRRERRSFIKNQDEARKFLKRQGHDIPSKKIKFYLVNGNYRWIARNPFEGHFTFDIKGRDFKTEHSPNVEDICHIKTISEYNISYKVIDQEKIVVIRNC